MSVELEVDLTLEQAVLMAIDAAKSQVWTALPGKVLSWDSTSQRATVQPLVQDVEPVRKLPSIPEVPVVFQRAGGFVLSLPIEPGDTGLLVFCALSPSSWMRSGGEGAPQDQRRHALSSAVFLPGLSRDALLSVPDTATLGKASNLLNVYPVAMAHRVNAFITAFDNAITPAVPGPMEPGFLAFKTSWTAAKALLNTDTGSTDVSVTTDLSVPP